MGHEQPDTRTRIQEAATALFRRNGYPGTGLKRIAAEANAPFGSIYHFFPGGKQQLAEATVRTAGAEYGRMVLALLESVADPIESVERAFEAAAEDLVASDYADACPIATVALEVASTDEVLRVATADVFAGWVDAGARWFGRWVPDRDAARSLAQSLVMLLEGAFVLSRAARDPEPLRVAAGPCPRCCAPPSNGRPGLTRRAATGRAAYAAVSPARRHAARASATRVRDGYDSVNGASRTGPLRPGSVRSGSIRSVSVPAVVLRRPDGG
ncbi:TetR/AcrR family transcriptional regulator [Streptomyces somaliensis]|nr:TetR/AcrR family transcriptional regulator [Streptomyces somaliensis]